MSAPGSLASLVGDWAGINHLWLDPGEPARESETNASVALAAQGRFVTIQYTWAEEGKPQDGLLLLGGEKEPNAARAVWIDSWHMGGKFMLCEGSVRADGAVSVKGAYAAPPGPDWGWRIDIEPAEPGSFRILMFNVSPEGKEERAVEATYARRP